jgi:hypothetical protein
MLAPSNAAPREAPVRAPSQRFLVGAAVLVALALVAPGVRADHDDHPDEVEVHVAGHQIVVVAKGDWHINQEYPWKVTIGETKLDKTRFKLTEKDATVVDVPQGSGKLKGAVCSHDACHMLERDVTIP